MVTISNFGSVLELAFGFNALFYIFELAPASDGRLERKLEKYDELVREKVELTRNTEAFPLGFVINSTYTTYKFLLAFVSIVMSIISLGVLVYSGFCPDATMSSYLMAGLVLISFLPIPVISLIIYYKASKWIELATEHIEEVVRAARVSGENSLRSNQEDAPARDAAR